MKTPKTSTFTLLALLLTFVLLATACAGGGSPAPAATKEPADTTSDNTGGSTTEETPTVEDGPFTPFSEKITITTCKGTSASQTFFDGDTFEDNRWLRLIEEKLNIHVDMVFTADSSGNAYRNKMNAQLASGDLPDIFYYSDRTFIQQAVDAGYLYDLTDLYEEYASDAVKSYREAYPDCFQGNTFDGRLRGFPAITDNFHHAVFLWIRDDWLEKSGKDVPKTVDEMVELARIFTEEDPDGNGIDDTYGFALQSQLYNTAAGSINGLISAFGVPTRGQGFFYRGEDGKITNSIIQPAVKEALQVTRDMYAKGYIDPEFVAKNSNDLTADIAAGKVGMSYQMNWGTWTPFNTIFESDGVITHPYPIPEVPGREVKIGLQSNAISDDGVFMMNSKCENPTAFFKIINLYEETVNESTENFLYYWDNSQAGLCPVYIRMPGELYAPILLPALAANDRDALPPGVQTYYDWVKNFEAGTETSSGAYGTWGQMFERGTMALSLEYVEAGQTVANLMANDRPEIWLTNASLMETPLLSGFTEIITGAQSIDYFDQVVAAWLSSGGQQTLDELEIMYPDE